MPLEGEIILQLCIIFGVGACGMIKDFALYNIPEHVPYKPSLTSRLRLHCFLMLLFSSSSLKNEKLKC